MIKRIDNAEDLKKFVRLYVQGGQYPMDLKGVHEYHEFVKHVFYGHISKEHREAFDKAYDKACHALAVCTSHRSVIYREELKAYIDDLEELEVFLEHVDLPVYVALDSIKPNTGQYPYTLIVAWSADIECGPGWLEPLETRAKVIGEITDIWVPGRGSRLET